MNETQFIVKGESGRRALYGELSAVESFDDSSTIAIGDIQDADDVWRKRIVELEDGDGVVTKREVNVTIKQLPPRKTKRGGEVPFSLSTKEQAYVLLDEIRGNNIKRLVLLNQSKEQKRFLHTVLSGAPERARFKSEQVLQPDLTVYHIDAEWYDYEPSNDDEECLSPTTGTTTSGYTIEILSHRASTIKSETWEWVVTGFLPKGAEVHLFAGKGRGKTKVCNYFNKLANDQGMRVVRFNMEDHEASILKPNMYAAGCNLELTEVVDRSALASKDGKQMPTSIDFSKPECIAGLETFVRKFGDVGLVIIEPINNYKGKSKAISEDDMRPIHTALATLAEKLNICILTVSHTNRKKDVDIQEKAHGASSGINVARVNLYLEKDPDGDVDERILADAGSNIRVGKSIVFKIVEQPPFELDGVTHKEIAVAVFDRETDTTAQDLSSGGESPARQSQAKDIGVWLVEYMTGKGDLRKGVVVGAAKQVNKDWSEDNITKVFNRRLRKLSNSRTEGGGKNKVTYWNLGKKEQTPIRFDGDKENAA